MCSGFRLAIVLVGACSLGASELRVCADPNNLPYSNSRGEGFENAIALLMAQELGQTLRLVWVPQRGRYVKKAVNPGYCDVVMGVLHGTDRLDTTKPYYRSTYTFVVRRDEGASIDDWWLHGKRIGVHVIPADGAMVPPVRYLAQHGLTSNIVGYKLYPTFSQPNPPSALIDAVAKHEIDAAVAWGPLAGYFAQRNRRQLQVIPMPAGTRQTPLSFDISMGVRHGNTPLLRRLDRFIDHRSSEIRGILTRFGVPLLDTRRMEARR